MHTMLPSEFRTGMALMIDGVPHLIEELHTTGTAKTKHKLHARLRNLHSGKLADRTFPEGERVGVAELQQRTVQFSYKQADRFVFLDGTTFDELSLTADQVGERNWFLKENADYRAYFLEGNLLDIVLPDHVALKVLQTAPAQRATQQSNFKPASLEGGLEVMVPLFIETGEEIRVDTRTRKYLGKEG